MIPTGIIQSFINYHRKQAGILPRVGDWPHKDVTGFQIVVQRKSRIYRWCEDSQHGDPKDKIPSGTEASGGLCAGAACIACLTTRQATGIRAVEFIISIFFERSKKKQKNLSLKSLLQQGYCFPSHTIQAVPNFEISKSFLGIMLSELMDCLQWPPAHDGSESLVSKRLLGGSNALWEALFWWKQIVFLLQLVIAWSHKDVTGFQIVVQRKSRIYRWCEHSRRNCEQLKLLILLLHQSVLARKSGGRGAACAWIASDFLDFLVLFRQGKSTIKIQGNKHLEFFYCPDQSRKIMKYYEKEGDNFVLKKTKYYILGNTEIEIDETTGETRTLNYIAGKAILEQSASGENLYYLHKDYLGTTLAVTNEDGDAIQRYAYDPWGRRRDPDTWANLSAPEISQQNFLFSRGYTGHCLSRTCFGKHLDDFGLINMNGRMYDPLLGRMLSPDNGACPERRSRFGMQAPDNSQNFNRYSYAMNNPLVYTDPDGEFVFLVPNIGLSKEGGLSLGVSLVFGIPGFASFQIGGGYSFQGQEPYGYAGASAGFNTVYTSITPSGGASVGYSFGMSPYTGFPVSSNAFTAGVDYNISNRSWSANVSSWYINNNELTFNPSISAMIYPEQTTNLIRGKGFRSNDGVLSRFVDAGNHQGALAYFGFMGTHIETDDYAGVTKFHGDDLQGRDRASISYGNPAFTSYETLLSINMKESYHYRKFVRGGSPNMTTKAELLANGATEEQIRKYNLLFAPEEFEGFEYAYKKAYLYKTKESHMYNYAANLYGYYANKELNLIRFRFYRKW